jgi:hypothetical protein
LADLYTNAGKALVPTALLALAAAAPTYGAWGTGSGQTATSTALATAAAPTATTAQSGTDSAVTTTVTGDTYQTVVTITAGGTLAITEFALWTNATQASGIMFDYHDFTVMNVVSGDSIEFTAKMKYA